MRFRAAKHSSGSGPKHGKPVAHGRFIKMPHRQGVVGTGMSPMNLPELLGSHPMGDGSGSPMGGPDMAPPPQSLPADAGPAGAAPADEGAGP